MQLVIAEKPSVGRDIARALGVRGGASKTHIEGHGRVITWCVGHLVELEEPAAYDGRWKAWRLDTLPMIPDRFLLRPVPSSRDQLRAVERLIKDRRFTEIVNACDAGREGELIFRYVYELAGGRVPVRRLWISSMTDEAIRAGFAALRPGGDYDALADAARCRSEADWLVGLNATRAVTVRHRTGEASTLYSIGRVQTPTLALLVERERAIAEFVPRDYFEVKGTFAAPDGGSRFPALWTSGKKTRAAKRDVADAIAVRAAAHGAAHDPLGPVVERVDQKKTREPPPLLFDLTSLQRTANRRFGLSAQRTLEVAQALYERHKVLTYPRTDARHLPGDMAAELPKLFRALAAVPDYAQHAAPLLERPPGRPRRVFDDAKVRDHHAIVPTGKAIDLAALDRDERRVFDLVARRFLGAFYPDAEFALTVAVVRVGGEGGVVPDTAAAAEADAFVDVVPPPPDRFVARGRVRLVAGWQAVAGIGDEPPRARGRDGDGDDPPEAGELPLLSVGDRLNGTFDVLAKQTRPPPRHTEATLLAAMETAGKTMEDEELRLAMKDAGLGTPATRASIIETLLKRGFVTRESKNLVPTPLGMALVKALPVPSLASAELTGRWEARLSRIARREDDRAGFMRDIATYVREVVEAVRAAAPNAALAAGVGAPPGPAARRGRGAKARAGGGKARGAWTPTKGEVRSQGARTRAPRAKRPAPDQPAAPEPGTPLSLSCPRCRTGTLVAGRRGWGCSRWREGCGFVVWFEAVGRRITPRELADLVAKGRTRKAKWGAPGGGEPRTGRLVLDVNAEGGAARFESE